MFVFVIIATESNQLKDWLIICCDRQWRDFKKIQIKSQRIVLYFEMYRMPRAFNFLFGAILTQNCEQSRRKVGRAWISG